MGDVEISATEAEQAPLLGTQEIENTAVYPVIHAIRRDIILMSPDLAYTLVKPLGDKYAAMQRTGNKSIVFCFLLNRVHFSRDQSFSTVALSQSRAALCEILAIRALRVHADDMLELTAVVTTSWPLFAGANDEVLKRAEQEEDMDVEDSVGNAIEMAILGKAKRFIKSSPCQKVIDGIWSGTCVYQANRPHSILSDTYKRTPVHFYNPHKAPLLDHYRLKVPAVRSVLEYINFLFLFILFVRALEYNDLHRINISEAFFMVFALGFSLEKLATIHEHGLKGMFTLIKTHSTSTNASSVYVYGTWNGFDVIFALWALEGGMDCLALAACLIFPRLAFVTLSNNIMILSLRSMFAEFALLMAIACFCFAGFLYALWTLSRNSAGYTSAEIAWWMLDLFFGLDATGFNNATTFHPLFGPILMVSYACLSNTLLLTGVQQILSHTFSTISSDAAAEAMFRRAVSTIEGVKADALFSYQPPLNLFALVIMFPASYILTPRWFHKVNVFMIRLTSFPILLGIALYERHKEQTGAITFYEHVSAAAERLFDFLPKYIKRMSFFEGLVGAGADIDAVFDIEDELTPDAELSNQTRSRRPSSSAKTFKRSSFGAHSQSNGQSNVPSTPEHRSPPLQAHQRPRAIPQRVAGVAEAFSQNISPLAQVYSPLPMDDDIVEDSALSSSPSPFVSTTGVSYGPATRRRFSSMVHRRTANDPGPGFSGEGSSVKRLESGSSNNEGYSLAEEGVPETVTELESEEEHLGGNVNLEKRLAGMEARQQRIEEMLIQLTQQSG
ncbi:hypothetical protein K439DRAFT_1646379 [Ramaria rubella]|nr:hypothetical protein K439DRAFT_1646379 [Ramaria rubella]